LPSHGTQQQLVGRLAALLVVPPGHRGLHTSLESWFFILGWPYFRFVNYYDLPR
jgi:hypothetical protein